MKKLLLLSLVCFSCSIYAQLDVQKSTYLNFLPSNINPENLKPSDIPSEQVLKIMGLSEEEIGIALDFKNGSGIFSEESSVDSLGVNTNLSKFYQQFGDTLVTDTIVYPIARIYGQDIFRNNSLSYYNRALDAKAPENYKVGSGDEITISVWGYSDFSETLLVDDRGYISPSSYGRIYVKGLTFSKMRSLIKSRFSSFLDMKNSEIDVTLAYSRVITVNIVGEVYNPGSYSIPAINTAFNALIASNGPNQLGSVRNIYLKREGKIVDSLDVYQFLFDPTRMPDIYMQDGDYLFVPPANNLVELKGAIKRPYTYEIKQGETVKDLINFAGGFTTNAFVDILTLKRIDYNTIKVYDIHKKHLNSHELQNGDEVIINQISSRLSNVVTVQGSIGVQGDYEYVKGERVLNLLERAKCIDERTFLEKLYIIRLNQDQTRTHISISLDSIILNPKHKDNIILNEYDIVRVLSIDDFDDNFFVYANGAVRKEGEFYFGDGMTLQDLLIQAGGLTQKAEGSRVEVSRIMEYDIKTNRLKPKRTIIKSVKIDEDLILSMEAKNFKLEPFDQVFVRENPDFESAHNVILSGEIKYPGVYTLLSKDEKISSLIKRAGGLTDYAYLDGVKMFRKFEAEIKEKEEITIDISDDLKNSIMADPFLSALYEKELRDKDKTSDDKVDNSTIFDEDLKEYVYDMVYLDLRKALSSNGSKHNLVLLENDSIIVPKIMDVVHITGELMNLDGTSISAPYFGARRANYYINNFAGGFTNENKRSGTIVIYPNGIAKQTRNLGLFKIYPKVKEGSTIKIVNKAKKVQLEKNPIDWNEAIENTMLKLTAILSLWLLVDRVAPAN